MGKRYKAVLFSLYGDWVTDYESDTKEEVIDKIENAGSRWFFFPIAMIILARGKYGYTTNTQRVIGIWDESWLKWMEGKSIKTIAKYISNLSEEEKEFLYYHG